MENYTKQTVTDSSGELIEIYRLEGNKLHLIFGKMGARQNVRTTTSDLENIVTIVKEMEKAEEEERRERFRDNLLRAIHLAHNGTVHAQLRERYTAYVTTRDENSYQVAFYLEDQTFWEGNTTLERLYGGLRNVCEDTFPSDLHWQAGGPS